MVPPHGPPFSKIVESTPDGPWIVTHIGQGGMVDDWWQSAPGRSPHPNFDMGIWGGGGSTGYLSGIYGICTDTYKLMCNSHKKAWGAKFI